MQRKREFGEVFTPAHIVTEMCNMVPEHIWANDNIKFFEPTCGTGNILIEIVQRRLNAGLAPDVVASTLLAFEIFEPNVIEARNRVLAILGEQYRNIINQNIVHVKCSLEVMQNSADMFNGEYVCIMNPPYHTPAKGVDTIRSKPVYQLFINSVIQNVKPKLMVSIHPNRWMSGGMGLDKFREQFKADKHIEEILYYPAPDIFEGACIAGGVQILKWNREYSGLCKFNGKERKLDEYDIIVVDYEALSILKKVLGK